MFDENGKPRFKVVVEGANLFFTQEARLEMEKRGVIVYKDAAANKGGVTSSSLEVLAALALTDSEFKTLMQVEDEKGNPPAFYSQYVKEVQGIIERNARLEFECIWRENAATGTPRSIISDTLSNRINQLNAALKSSSLYDDIELRARIIAEACPKILVDTLGVHQLVERVPNNYVRAIFGARLASTFIYEYGLHAPEFAFFDYMQRMQKKGSHK
jgi:glutamate dehydrogenase